jgi:hypothetical protein
MPTDRVALCALTSHHITFCVLCRCPLPACVGCWTSGRRGRTRWARGAGEAHAPPTSLRQKSTGARRANGRRQASRRRSAARSRGPTAFGRCRRRRDRRRRRARTGRPARPISGRCRLRSVACRYRWRCVGSAWVGTSSGGGARHTSDHTMHPTLEPSQACQSCQSTGCYSHAPTCPPVGGGDGGAGLIWKRTRPERKVPVTRHRAGSHDSPGRLWNVSDHRGRTRRGVTGSNFRPPLYVAKKYNRELATPLYRLCPR